MGVETTLPKISIVTPSYNQGKYLEKTILSVLEQGYPNLEYIIIDGGSTDESVEIIRKYQDRLAYWVSEPDRGQSHAINKGFERATGEIFGWLNSDDWYHPGALQAVAEAFAANPDAGAVVGAGDMYSEEYNCTQTIEPFPVTVQSLYGAVDRFFMQPSCFFKSTGWETCGPLDEDLHLAMDLDLWFKIAKKCKYAITDRNLSVSLVHGSAKTTALAPQSLVDASLVIMQHGGVKEGRDRLVGFVQELYDERQKNALQRQKNALLVAEKEHLDRGIKYLLSEIAEYVRTIYEMKQVLLGKEQQLVAYENSLSWRITAPLRRLAEQFSVAASPPPIAPPAAENFLDLDRMAELVADRTTDRGAVLLLDFNLGGGSNIYSRELIVELERLGETVLILEYRFGLKVYHLKFCTSTGIAEMVATDLTADWLADVVSRLGIRAMIVSQLVSWPKTADVLSAIMAAGVPYLVLMHDYFMVCPNWTLFDYREKYCAVPDDPEVCAACLNGLRELDISLGHHTDSRRIEPWRRSAGLFLEEAAQAVCFSAASREVVLKAYPSLGNTKVIEHSVPDQELFPWKLRSYSLDEPLTVAVVGGVTMHKGSLLVGRLLESQRVRSLPFRVVVIGDILPLPASGSGHSDNLLVHGSYERRDLSALLEHYHASVVLIPSLWPETFCYTASEALLLGYPVICNDIGAQAERVRKHDAGWVVTTPYLDGILSVIQQIIAAPQSVQEKSLNTRRYQPVLPTDHFTAIADVLNRMN